MLNVVLCAYARGIGCSRVFALVCIDYSTFIALCPARTPPFATLTALVNTMGPDITRVSAAQEEVIGREILANDGE